MNDSDFDTFEDDAATHCSPSLPLKPYLFVVLECDRPTANGARLALDGVEHVLIGRGTERSTTSESDTGGRRLILRLPGRSMSSTHAKLVRTTQGFRLEDLCSTNGSFVNGKRTQAAQLKDGDLLKLGHTLMIYREALPTPAGTVPIHDIGPAANVDSALCTLLPVLAAELDELKRFAQSPLPILLLGKSGTGKELLSRAIHRQSGRSGRFIAVNCGALSPNLVESQLFGHVKGAFSGATRDEPGLIRSADGGTLLLDELGDLPLAAQPTLLRVLQEKEVTPVGSSHPIPVDVRFLAATHRPLKVLMAEEQFRGDLFARLDGYRHHLPDLTSRREDFGLILTELLRRHPNAGATQITPGAGASLLSRSWQFNIRELQQCVERALVRSSGGLVEEAHVALSPDLPDTTPITARPHPAPTRPLSPENAALKQRLLHELEDKRGNVTAVATGMGKARVQVMRWMKRFGIDPATFRA